MPRLVLGVLLAFAVPGTASAATIVPCDVSTAIAGVKALGARAASAVQATLAIVIDPSTVPDATLDQPYEVGFTASGGFEPYSYACTGELPPGLVLDATGTLHGTPTEAGTYAFTLEVSDVQGQFGSQGYALTVNPPVIGLAPTAVPDGTVGVDYAVTLTASGGTAPYTFAVTGGTLPPGLFLSSDGTLNGAPTLVGDYAFLVTATDNFNRTGVQSYDITVQAPTITITPATLPVASVGTAYEQPLAASGGTGPYSFSIVSGTLPPGMSMDGDGIVDGTPEAPGTFAFVARATDTFAQSGDQPYTLVVEAPAITLTPATLPDAPLGVDYAVVLAASGGIAPYTFAVTAGALPPGLSLSSDGTLDGAPATAGTYAFTVTATDNYDSTGVQSYDITVDAATITITPATLPGASVGIAYEQALSASGGTGPYAFAIVAGALPAGMSMDGDGIIDGTPEAPGTFPFTVQAMDAFGQAGDQPYTLVVAAPTITLAPSTLPPAALDEDYEVAFSASGGIAPYTFALAGGALPPGMSLSSDGTLSGAPQAAGQYAFTVEALDSYDQAGEQDYLLAVAGETLPDPTLDPDVIGLVTSQVSTVRTFATTQIANVHDRLETLHDGGGDGWGFWIAGSVRSGDRDGNGEASPLSFETSGMTGGTDYRPGNAFAFGGALGFARDRTAVGDDGSRNDGEAPSGVSYMSWHPEDLPFFLDGLGGHQEIAFDVRRVSDAGITYEGRRTGKQDFTSWSGGYEHRTEAFLFSPYARVDASNARLHGFREQGDDPLALQFGSQAVDLRTTTLGFRMKYRMDTEWGEFEPRLRMEFQRDFHEDEGVAIRYANQLESPVFVTSPVALDRNRVVVELGGILRTHWYDLLIRVDYLGVFGGYNDNEHAVRFSFQED